MKALLANGLSWGKSLLTGGAGISTYLVIALGISVAFGLWQLARVSDRDETIGAQRVVIKTKDDTIAARESELRGERADRLRDRADAALNSELQRQALNAAQSAAGRRRIIEKVIYVDKPIPAEVEARCADDVLAAFNADVLPWLHAIVNGAGATAAAAGPDRAGAAAGLRPAGAAAD